ncbi:MAG: HAMP domain-containing histidine kinase [Turicibacter sp.]|nr:HAMP domain-containing histidine kinase [Turicibacter sp.]
MEDKHKFLVRFICWGILLSGISLVIGYFILDLLFSIWGEPSRFSTFAIFSGIFLLTLLCLLNGGIAIAKKFFNFSEHELWHLNVISTLKAISQGNFNVTLEDETGRLKELTDTINHLARELGNREAIQQEFISNVSHEFQSPLTSIRGYAKLLRDGAATTQQQEYADILLDEGQRLSRLSENLLRLSALEALEEVQKKEFRLDRQLEDTLLLLEPQWSEKSINLDVELPKTSLVGDAELLKQVWINLLTNAIKFTGIGGNVSVKLAHGCGEITCEITDDGIGISPDDQLRIFERFYKADKSRERARGGNGLGLSIVKKILNIHGATIHLESALGKGTQLKIIFKSSFKF